MAKISSAVITRGSKRWHERQSLWRTKKKQVSEGENAKKLWLSKSHKESRGQQKPIYLTLSEKVDSLSAVALTAVGIPCHFPRSTLTHTHTRTQTHVRRLFSTACQLYLFNPDQWVVLHQGPVSAPVINMWVPLYQPQLQINQRVGHRRKGANISSITPERHHGEMQIASQESPGDVKEKLAGRQREANEYNGKCIQGEGENPLYSYQLIQSYQWRCTVKVEAVSNPLPSSPISTSQAFVLFNTGQATVIRPVGGWARPGELRRF